MSHFRPIDRDIDFLLPPSLQDWLPEGHLARYVVEVVEGLDLSELEEAYAWRGSAPSHPATLRSLLIDGYATGCFSSRKIDGQSTTHWRSATSPATAFLTTTPCRVSGGVSARSSRRSSSRCWKSRARTSSTVSPR